MDQCNYEDCTNTAVADWGVCFDCFVEEMDTFENVSEGE
jgi:hypothetical protein